ncbi:DnaJ domain-containing protein [Limibacter armeniacum]|uniref:J domain-containing protein n=1 Tax=Limibacter armeniacum TaxID=466084 RepID=UPI002FE67BA9
MILNRLKDILIANIFDQLENNPVFKDNFRHNIEDLEKEFGFDFNKYTQSHDKKHAGGYGYEHYDHQQYGGNRSSYEYTKTVNKEREYYEALELPNGAPYTEIKKAYRKLMKIYHPDLYNNDPEKFKIAQEVSLKINEAYTYFSRKHK